MSADILDFPKKALDDLDLHTMSLKENFARISESIGIRAQLYRIAYLELRAKGFTRKEAITLIADIVDPFM